MQAEAGDAEDEAQPSGPDAEPSSALPHELAAAAAQVAVAIDATAAEKTWTWSELAFEALASAVFRAQYEHVPIYRAWCDHELAARGHTVEDVNRWTRIPALPIGAFKQERVAAHAPEQDVVCWTSSGTTGAATSTHPLPDTALYRASLLAAARAALVPEPRGEQLLALQLAPGAEELPDSSLSYMFDLVRTTLCRDGGAWAHGEDSAVDAAGAWERLGAAADHGEAVLLMTTSFGLVQLLDATADEDALALPPGSRLMDTGGYKGRTRELSREQLVAAARDRLGLLPSLCENEYGMSELSSQAYLGTIADQVGRPLPGSRPGDGTAGPRWQPPWFRTRVVDPSTLEEVADGQSGLLVHHDLANAWTCAAVRSEDVGVRRGRTWEFVGRAPGADLRGCSLRLEDVI